MILRLFVATLLIAGSAFAKDRFKTLHVEDLDKLLTAKQKVFVYDVNTESTREKVGLIPGAALINDGSDYSVEKSLPKDKKSKLVFYCANTMCTASHTAAEKAISSGYKDVSVMVDGIYGWRDAKKKLEPLKKSPQAMKPKEVNELMKADSAFVVDVREAEERHEVVDKAHWSPMSGLMDSAHWNKFVSDLPKDKTVVFYCAAGGRSKKMAEKLAAEGIRTAYFKGPDEWKSEGLPLKQGPAK